MLKPCPICSSTKTRELLSRLSVPVHQNLVMQSEQAALTINKGDLHIAWCQECDFVFNQTFEEAKLDYGQHYDNTQECSGVFKKHLQERMDYLVREKEMRNKRITEVGCGKGGFLKLLTESRELNNMGYGYDPTYIGPASFYEGRLHFVRSFYNETASHLPTDAVICRHVIEHIENPLDFLKLIKKTLSHSPHARLFFETPCLKWILKNRVIWDFFYEHCSYYTKETLAAIFERAGFSVENVTHVFGGQYLWMEASLSQPEKKNLPNDIELHTLIEEYRDEEVRMKIFWGKKLKQLKECHKVALWGAGAKGVTFANLIDPEREIIDCLIDINPRKQNFFAPGSAHPILSYQEAANRGVSVAVMMNENYLQESREMLKKEGIAMELVIMPLQGI